MSLNIRRRPATGNTGVDSTHTHETANIMNTLSSHTSEYCNAEKLRRQKNGLGPTLYQNRSSMSSAWQTLGFKAALEQYVRELKVNAVQTAQEDDNVSAASLRLSILEHICSCWGDEENAVSIHQCIMDLQRRSKNTVSNKYS